MSDEALGGEAELRLTVISNLRQSMTDLDNYNESLGGTDKAVDNISKTFPKLNAAITTATGSTQRGTSANKAASTAADKQTNSINAQRYALYNVSNALGIAGAGLTGFAALAYKTAIDYQADFSNVLRTTQATGKEATALQSSLLGLSQTLPVSYQSITNIASMGGQLGIVTSEIPAFTKVVAEFATTTGVSTDTASTAFGRLNALLPDVNGNFNALGSSILKVGINSVATESQIINIATRLAGIGHTVGLTSSEVIGLSGALASLGIAPELAQGTLTRLFTKIQTAIAADGSQLQEFAAVSGTTATQFTKDWGNDASGTLVKLLQGINASGGDAIGTIQSLGLSSARDIPTLLKLSQNTDILTSSLSDASTGFKEGTQLGDSYGVKAKTVAQQLVVLTNNFQALLAAIGQTATGIAPLVGQFDDLLKSATDWAKTPLGSAVEGDGVALIGLLGIATLASAAMLRLAATVLAVQTGEGTATGVTGIFSNALAILTGRATTAAASETGLITQTSLTSGAMDAATASTGAFSGASIGLKAGLIGLAAVISIGLLDDLYKLTDAATNNKLAFTDAADAAAQYNKQVEAGTSGTHLFPQTPTQDREQILQKTTGVAGAVSKFDQQQLPFGSGDLVNHQTGAAQAQESIDKIDASMAKLVKSNNAGTAAAEYDKWSTAAKLNGTSQSDLAAKFPKYEAAIKAAADATGKAVSPVEALNKATADALKSQSDSVDADLKQQDALYALGNSLGSTSDDFSEYSEAGRTNLSNLEAVVSAVAAETAGDAQATADNLQGLFNALTQQAAIPAAALTFLSDSIASLGVTKIDPTNFNLASLNQGFVTGQASAQKLADKTAAAAKQVKTLADYGNDLSTVFKRAFDIRFGDQSDLDAITSGWSAIAAASKDAATNEQKAYASLAQLASDKSIDEYWLTVANAYGDTLRAAQIQADLAQNASDTADAQDSLTTATNASNKSLVGNSDAAIANRASILGLVTNYETYIQSLASSGLSQAALSQKTTQLKADFLSQAEQLGFNSKELGTYSSAFDDVGTAIAKVPRSITVTANANPAMQALNEFLANAKTAIGSGLSVPIAITTPTNNPSKIAADQLAWKNYYAAQAANINTPAQFAALKAQFVRVTGITDGFEEGGYTGNGGVSDIAGAVHGQEFVFSAPAVRNIGVQNLAYAHQMAKRGKGFQDGGYTGGPSSSGGSSLFGGGYAQLSPFDRQLLVDIRNAIDMNALSPSALKQGLQAATTNSATRRSA